MAENKDTIYVDIDDEITGIIDKVRGSNGKIVALVLPKRAAVFQSIVNTKLLKRAADDAKKHLVLITTEAGLLPLAGAAGIHVAKTLNSKPEVPSAPTGDDGEETVDEAPLEELPVTDADADKPIGELAGIPATPSDDMETLELDDDTLPEEEDTAIAPKTFAPLKKDKKLAVPDFNRFRTWLLIGGSALVLLVVGLILALNVLPKATINIKTDATSLNVSQDLKLSTTAKELDLSDNTVPAKLASQQKTYSQQVPATGQKNNGSRATGSVTLINCSGSDATIPAGTGLSSGGNTYITQDTATVPDSNYSSPLTGSKCKNDGKASVDIAAQNGGAAYNMPSGANFSVAGHSSISGQGSTISGGTDNIVTVVSQADINSAKAKINSSDASVKQTLQDDLKKDNYFSIASTFNAGNATSTNSSNPGDVASSVTVTETITYTMFGASEQDLKTLVDNAVKDQIDTSKQGILSEGLDHATFGVNSTSSTGAQLTMQTTATAGPDIDVNGIRQLAAGKKPGDVKRALSDNPDVTDVNVKLSPFWVSSVPKKTSKVKVVIAKPEASKTASTNDRTP
jgi:hypothetical protein